MTDKAVMMYESAPLMQRSHENRLKAVGNIYFIFVNDTLVYVGQRQAKAIKTRLDQHLFGKSFSMGKNNVQNGTVSKWDRVKAELDQGNNISFKTILIHPDSLRTTIELELIKRLDPPWNLQGK